MATYDTGKMILFIQSILWDLHVPQEAATVLFKDYDGCTAMGNTQKPTSRTRHINIKYISLCDWVERNLMLFERIDTSLNMSDNMTKGLRQFYSITTRTSFLVTFRQCTPRFMTQLLAGFLTTHWTLTVSSHHLLLLP